MGLNIIAMVILVSVIADGLAVYGSVKIPAVIVLVAIASAILSLKKNADIKKQKITLKLNIAIIFFIFIVLGVTWMQLSSSPTIKSYEIITILFPYLACLIVIVFNVLYFIKVRNNKSSIVDKANDEVDEIVAPNDRDAEVALYLSNKFGREPTKDEIEREKWSGHS